MCISPTNMHWRERPTTSGQKSLEKEELFTLEENLRWTSASSARLFLSWAQASPSVLEEEKDNDQCPISCPSSLVGSVRQTWHNTLYHIFSAKSWKKVTGIRENNQPLWPRQNSIGTVCGRSLKTKFIMIREARASISKILQDLILTTTKLPPMQFFHCLFYFTPYFREQIFTLGEKPQRSC